MRPEGSNAGRKSSARAGQQNRKLVRRCKLTTQRKTRPEGSMRKAEADRRAGQQNGRLSRRCKLSVEMNVRRIGWAKAQAGSTIGKQIRTKGLWKSRGLKPKGWSRGLARRESRERSAMAGLAEAITDGSEVGSKDEPGGIAGGVSHPRSRTAGPERLTFE